MLSVVETCRIISRLYFDFAQYDNFRDFGDGYWQKKLRGSAGVSNV